MEREPNLVISRASQRIVEDGVPFKVAIYKLEGGDGWSLASPRPPACFTPPTATG